jgi:hypothetical protein
VRLGVRRVSQHRHPGGDCGGDPPGTVLDHDATLRHDAHPFRGVEEEIGIGLAALDFVAGEDPPGEALVQPGQAQGQRHLLVAAAGGDAGRQGDLVERPGDPRHRPQFAPEGRRDRRVELRLPVVRERPAEPFLDPAQRRRHPDPEELADAVLVGHR